MRKSTILLAAVSAVPFLGFDQLALANPFASNVSSDGSNVTFVLNENASDVSIVRDNQAPVSLGSLAAGQQSFSLNGATNYSIIVSNNSALGYNYFSSASQLTNEGGGTLAGGAVLNTASLSGATNPRGVAVNNNAASPFFGRVYGELSGNSAGPNTFYVTPDLNPNNINLNNGGGTYSTSGNSPLRISVGADDNVYISDWSDATAGLFVTDPNLNNWQLAFAGRGSQSNTTVHGAVVSKAVVLGSAANGNLELYTVDQDLHQDVNNPGTLTTAAQDGAVYQSIWHYTPGSTGVNINTSPTLVATNPTGVAPFPGIVMDLARNSSNGNLYYAESRDAGGEPGLIVFSPSGQKLWDSLSTTRSLAGNNALNDVIRMVRGVAISPDNKYIAIATGSSSPPPPALPLAPGVFVIPLDSSGIPVLAEARFVGIGGFIARDVAFDAADNIYFSNSGSGAFFALSPGGLTKTVYSNNAGGTAGAFTSTALDPTWTSSSTGNFSDTSKWLLSFVPNMTGLTASFDSAITADTAVNVDTAVTLGGIKFNNTHSYTLSSNNGSNITLSTFDPAGALVSVANGSHTISVPVVLGNNTTVNVANANNVMTFSGDITTTGSISFTTTGAGTTKVKSLNVGALNVSSGKLQMTAPRAAAATTVTKALTVGAGATLDLGNNDLIDDYGNGGTADPALLGSIRGLIQQGYNNGAWTGTGITSSAAAADAANSAKTHKTGLGYAEGSTIGGTHNTTNLDSDAIAIAYTYYGDANLSGTVDTSDFTALSQHFGNTNLATAGSAVWVEGDFNYDGVVNALDFNDIASNFGATPIVAPGPGLGSLVPEPTSLSLLAFGLVALRNRRRRA